jgi:hypothetical protein
MDLGMHCQLRQWRRMLPFFDACFGAIASETIAGDVELDTATTVVFIFTFRKNLFALYFVRISASS